MYSQGFGQAGAAGVVRGTTLFFFLFLLLINPALAKTVTDSLFLRPGTETTLGLTFPSEAKYYSLEASWADASGEAASWVTPKHIEFGYIRPGETSGRKYYTIKVPVYQNPGIYELKWTYSCRIPGTTCYADTSVYQIEVREPGQYAYDFNIDIVIDENGNRAIKNNVTISVEGTGWWEVEYSKIPMDFRAWDREGNPLIVDKEELDNKIRYKINFPRKIEKYGFYSFTYQANFSGFGAGFVQRSPNVFEYNYFWEISKYKNAYGGWDPLSTHYRITIHVPSNAIVLDANGFGVKRKGTDISFEKALYQVNDEINGRVGYSLPSLKVLTPSVSERAPMPTKTQSTASVSLHAEKTDVTVGEEITAKLSVVNIIGNPVMQVQEIIIPPSGMSLLSSEFSMSLGGQYSGNFTAPPDKERIIKITLKTNQEGDFELKGKAFYYFGDNISTKEESEHLLPIKVRPKGETTATKPANGNSLTPTPAEIPGFVGILAIVSILCAAYLLSRKQMVRKTTLLFFLFLLFLIWTANLAAGFSPGDIEWANAASGTLYRDKTLTNGQYMVKAVEFPSAVHGIKDINGNIVPETEVEPWVSINVYKNGELIKDLKNRIMTQQSEAYIDPDYEVKVSATGFMAKNAREWVYEYYNPWATISIQLRAKPKLEVTVTTDKSVYTSYNDQIITATVVVKNTGEAKIKNVDVNLNTGELKLRGGDASQLHRYYNILEKGASQSFSVILVVPELIDQKSYSLSVDAKGYDVKDLEYRAAQGSSSLTVSPKQIYFTISKAVKDRMYLQDTAIIRITIANGGMYDIYNIHVSDSMSQNFELKSNTSFQWDIPILKPGQEWGTTYSVKPNETNLNGFTIPAATAQFTVNNKPYSASSQTPKVIVNGPKIILNKTVDRTTVNLSEEVMVTVSINNVGNIATKTEIKDSLPEGVSLVSDCIPGWIPCESTIFLELNTPKKFEYSIRMDKEGEITLQPAIANYTGIEYKGTTRSVLSSERPLITVIDPSRITPAPTETPSQAPTQTASQETTTTPSPTNTSEPTPTPITPGFDIVFAVIVLIFAAVHRRR